MMKCSVKKEVACNKYNQWIIHIKRGGVSETYNSNYYWWERSWTWESDRRTEGGNCWGIEPACFIRIRISTDWKSIGEIKVPGVDSKRKSFPSIFHVKFITNTGIESKEYKGTVSKAGKVYAFSVLKYPTLVLSDFQSGKYFSNRSLPSSQ